MQQPEGTLTWSTTGTPPEGVPEPNPDGLVTGADIGRQLCEALGLDPRVTLSVSMKVDGRNVVHVDVERYVTRRESMAAIEIIRQRFRLVEREPASVAPASGGDNADMPPPTADDEAQQIRAGLTSPSSLPSPRSGRSR